MKMNFAKIGFAILLGTATLVSSCNKYEEGPSFSLLSAKMRITGDWTATAMTVNNEDTDMTNLDMTISVNNDGTFSSETVTTIVIGSLSSSYTTTEVGTWDFNSDKTSVLMMADGASSATEATILKLENKEMKLRTGSGSSTTDITYSKN